VKAKPVNREFVREAYINHFDLNMDKFIRLLNKSETQEQKGRLIRVVKRKMDIKEYGKMREAEEKAKKEAGRNGSNKAYRDRTSRDAQRR
jgi:hypothetical protein